MESISQTLKQVEQYQTQLQQYEDQIKNSVGPATQIWDKANQTINDLNRALDTLDYYKKQAGSIDQYLAKYKDVEYYKNTPCFNGGKCSPTEKAALDASRDFGIESQKRSNDAMFRSLDQQQSNLQRDAEQLTRLQGAASGADGRLAAIQYGNQLASNQANQLLQVRALLVAQQNAMATKSAADNDRAAQESAASKQLRSGNFTPSSGGKGMIR